MEYLVNQTHNFHFLSGRVGKHRFLGVTLIKVVFRRLMFCKLCIGQIKLVAIYQNFGLNNFAIVSIRLGHGINRHTRAPWRFTAISGSCAGSATRLEQTRLEDVVTPPGS